jgi:hypothetical protein
MFNKKIEKAYSSFAVDFEAEFHIHQNILKQHIHDRQEILNQYICILLQQEF